MTIDTIKTKWVTDRTKLIIPEQNNSGRLITLDSLIFDKNEFFKARDGEKHNIYTIASAEAFSIGKDIVLCQKQPNFPLFALLDNYGATPDIPVADNLSNIDYLRGVFKSTFAFGKFIHAEFVEPFYLCKFNDKEFGMHNINRPPYWIGERVAIGVRVYESK